MEKNLRFDMIVPGTEFQVKDNAVIAAMFVNTVAPADGTTFVKKSNSSAVILGQVPLTPIRMHGKDVVVVTLPDPTPEEVAAKEAEDARMRIEWARRGLVNGIEACEGKLARFTERLANNPHDAFSWGQETAEAAGKLFAYKRLLALFDDKGCEAAREYALREALSGARNPQHSTAALSNIVAEAVTTGYAEFASRSLF